MKKIVFGMAMLAGAGALAATVSNVTMTVTDAAGKDYGELISLTVEDGKLRLVNSSAVRAMIIIR